MRRKPKRVKRNLLTVFTAVLSLTIIISAIAYPKDDIPINYDVSTADQVVATVATEPPVPDSHIIEGIPVVVQDYYKAGCETYACTMLLQGLGYDIDEHEFVDKYLIRRDIYYGDDGTMYAPDMNSAFVGDIFTGCGINSPAMAKSMNNFLITQPKNKLARAVNGHTLKELCDLYIDNDIPVMTWVTTYMMESYEKMSWAVNFVDENATHKVGETMAWRQNEHCMVLIGYDKDNYIFCDSVAGKVVSHEKELAETRFQEIGLQAVVVK